MPVNLKSFILFLNCAVQQVCSRFKFLLYVLGIPINHHIFIKGLTDSMRENFHLMRALAEHTRISPKLRISKLMTFNRRLRSEDAISKELKEWNLQLDDKLVNIPARCIPPEKIVLGNKRTAPAGPTADWTRELHNKALFNPARLANWVIIHMDRMRSDVEVRYI